MIGKNEKEIRGIFNGIVCFFIIFLLIPMVRLFMQSIWNDGHLNINSYGIILNDKKFLIALKNSLYISFCSSFISLILAYILSYSIHYTNISRNYKKWIEKIAIFPMLFPTITYGFVILYSLGKQGIWTKVLGKQWIQIYGFYGLCIGYVIYTLPISFLMLHTTMKYMDKKFIVISKLLGDSPIKTVVKMIIIPLLNTMLSAFIQCFFLCFTDFGIPASLGGKFTVLSEVLYNSMVGSIPSFGVGAAIAIFMLIPSIISMYFIFYMERYNIRYEKISIIDIPQNKSRDCVFGICSGTILLGLISIFIIIVVVPFVENWPYQLHFTMNHVKKAFYEQNLISIYRNSFIVAILTGICGTLIAYGAALITARSTMGAYYKKLVDILALVINTIPGMVLGIAYLFCFTGTGLQNTIIIILVCNIVHFFSTPYFILKNSLLKLNASWETAAKLMGDSWIWTLLRIITPNIKASLWEVFSYYFINAMVTVSGVIFLVGAKTAVVTTKIKELQYFNQYNEIFLLSLFIFITNIVIKSSKVLFFKTSG